MRARGEARSPGRAARLPLAALALAVLAVVPAAAQPPPAPGPAPGRPTGPLTPAPLVPDVLRPDPADTRPVQFRSFLRLEGEYNDNFFLSETNKREVFREFLTPGVSLRLARGRDSANLSYLPSLVHSSLNEGDLEVFHLFDGSGSLALTERLTLNATDRFLRSDALALTDPRGIRRDRVILTENTAAANLAYQQDVWSLVPRYGLTFNRNEGGDRERSIVHTAGVDGTRTILERNTVGAGYEFTQGNFRLADDFTGHTGRLSFARQLNPLTTADIAGVATYRDVHRASDYYIYSADIGLRRDVSPRYTVEGRVGYNLTDAVDGGGDAEGVTFLLRGTYVGKAFRFTTTSLRSIQETFLERENVGLTDTVESTWELQYEATRRLSLVLRARLAQNEFLQLAGPTAAGTSEDREDLVLGGGLEVNFRLTRLLLLTVGYSYTKVDSNLRGFDYENNQGRLSLSVIYP